MLHIYDSNFSKFDQVPRNCPNLYSLINSIMACLEKH